MPAHGNYNGTVVFVFLNPREGTYYSNSIVLILFSPIHPEGLQYLVSRRRGRGGSRLNQDISACFFIQVALDIFSQGEMGDVFVYVILMINPCRPKKYLRGWYRSKCLAHPEE